MTFPFFNPSVITHYSSIAHSPIDGGKILRGKREERKSTILGASSLLRWTRNNELMQILLII